MAEGDHQLQPPAAAPAPALPPGFHIGEIHLDNSPGANVSVGQEGLTVQQLTWPQRLAHSKMYWLVHFLIAVAAAMFVEWLARVILK